MASNGQSTLRRNLTRQLNLVEFCRHRRCELVIKVGKECVMHVRKSDFQVDKPACPKTRLPQIDILIGETCSWPWS